MVKASANSNHAKFDFEDEKFNAPPSQTLPWCQMIRPRYGEDGLQSYGLALKLDNAQAVGFQPDDNWQEIEHEFDSGEVDTFFITTTPRLVIIRRGPLSVQDRDTKIRLGTFKDYKDDFLANKLKFKIYTRHLIFLVGEDKKFLHQSPLQLTLSGAAGASFGKSYSEYQQGRLTGGFAGELEKAYASFQNKPLTPKGPLFHAHGIFCPIIECEERGIEPNIVLVAATVNYEHPKDSNLTKYMIASDSPESEIICKIFEDYKEFGKEFMKPDVSKAEISGVTNSYIYADDDDFAYPPY
ncbi:MAG: DUF5895 domain-containing protein [Sphaerospermopsis kisseleviana]|uniref:DUF5895 domain-containing protein n=1 Tax=Sphaerospermopsis kisseleviana CS-549 TaxID=3021783 RepID=A0ABT4ZX10_9CYAN|nr:MULTISPECIES: DUF5895 domain-containing protein [Sphaerospermopsis]MBD2135879.1 hypothetical protein [Sphaerospermopsis sp. FACHB-1094]MBD2148214.1 hypothetical protein [Sphaerospermopsis sp. FACHB-1194]MDB9443550.1 DUF5895 domain-containing protein [Sphaerospermopsis kisseleviana CS-549]BAZ83029.1 hypothetical protein NIES73_43120 [Sphaerospermopsis kisseleviana NIES-73]